MRPTDTRTTGELAASIELRVLTNEAVDLINAAFPIGVGPSKRVFLVPSSLRRYVVQRPVPFVITKEGETGAQMVYLKRLTVRDLTRSLPRERPKHLAVLDNSAFHQEGIAVVARTGATPGAPTSFSHARTAHLMRFWIDVRHELGKGLEGRMTPDDCARLHKLRDKAGLASAASLREQRLALGVSQRRFAQAIGIPVAGIIRVEDGEVDLTSPLLERFLSAFDDLWRSRKRADPGVAQAHDTTVAGAWGGEILKRRTELGITQKALAAQARVGEDTLSKAERGGRVSLKTQSRIVRALTSLEASKQRVVS
jgi:transcriptional regulator with XRE-family HTH domain